MKIITWNCNMAFRKKAATILAQCPDLLVVPECEGPAALRFPEGVQKPADMLWFGKNPNKGLGIFAYGTLRLNVLDVYDERFQLVVPVRVRGAGFSFTLFAIWANNPGDPDGPYVTQVWKAINHYSALIKKSRTLLIGDFNSNTIWDRPRRAGNHSTVVDTLAEKGIHSVYHWHFEQAQGKEAHPTLYLYRHEDKPYHLDYCFASDDMLRHLQSVEVGTHEAWCALSDHVPMIVRFDDGLFQKKAGIEPLV